MTIALQQIIAKVRHTNDVEIGWHSIGGRACPIGWNDCSQPVYESNCGQYTDHGERGGPGDAFCRTECHHGHQPPDEPDLEFGEADAPGVPAVDPLLTTGRQVETVDELHRAAGGVPAGALCPHDTCPHPRKCPADGCSKRPAGAALPRAGNPPIPTNPQPIEQVPHPHSRPSDAEIERGAFGVPAAAPTSDDAARAVASWKKAAANMVAHWKANGPTVEAQWCTHAAQLLSMGGELMPDGVKVERPSREWYAEKIADTMEAEDAAGGVLAAGGAPGVSVPGHQTFAPQTPRES